MRLQAGHPDQVSAESLAAAGLPVDAATFAADPAAALAKALAGLPGETAADRLNSAQIAAVPARRVSGVVRDPRLVATEFVHVRPGAGGPGFVTPGRMATFGRTARFGPLRSPGTGEHSFDTLREAGLTDEEIEALVATGVVIAGEPMAQALPTAYR